MYHYLIPSSLLIVIHEIFRYQQPVDISPAFLPLAEQPSQETFQLGDGKVLVAAHAYRFLQIKSIDSSLSLECNQISCTFGGVEATCYSLIQVYPCLLIISVSQIPQCGAPSYVCSLINPMNTVAASIINAWLLSTIIFSNILGFP